MQVDLKSLESQVEDNREKKEELLRRHEAVGTIWCNKFSSFCCCFFLCCCVVVVFKTISSINTMIVLSGPV